jgi:hypothetical protein
MAIGLQPIYTQTIGSGGAAGITFNNIPQTFTDLMIKVSGRFDSNPESSNWCSFKIFFNGDNATFYSFTAAYGGGTFTGSERASSQTVSQGGWLTSSAATANTFGSADIYIPNYTGSNFKSFISDSVTESNATAALLPLVAGLWSKTNAITSISFNRASTNFVQNSTFTLYGITKG